MDRSGSVVPAAAQWARRQGPTSGVSPDEAARTAWEERGSDDERESRVRGMGGDGPGGTDEPVALVPVGV
jgi:hypothetical protein